MEKIKDLKKVILPDRAMLVEIIKPKRMIITPDGGEDKDSYGVVITRHPSVTEFEEGDIIIKYGGQLYGYTINANKTNERTFTIMHVGAVNIGVKPDNFIDPDMMTSKLSV